MKTDNFNKEFYNSLGVSPSEYRKKHFKTLAEDSS